MPLPSNFGYVWKNLVAGSAHPGGTGDLPGTLAALREHGFRAILTLTELPLDFSAIKQAGFEYLHLPIVDFTAPNPQQIESGVAFLQEQAAQGNPALVHCHAGIGRTGTMLACFLVAQGMDATEAIRHVRRLRPGSVEVYAQEYAVYQYAKKEHDAPGGNTRPA